MNNKFLLSTILASSIIMSAPNVLGAGVVTYNQGQYTFDFNGSTYSDPLLLEQAIENSSVSVANPFTASQIQSFVIDLITGTDNQAKQNLINNLASFSLKLFDEEVTPEEINLVISQTNQAISSGLFEETDVKNLIKEALSNSTEGDYFQAIEEIAGVIGQVQAVQPLLNQTKSTISSTKSNIAASNPTVADLVNQIDALANGNKTIAEDDTIDELNEELYSLLQNNSEFTQVRNSAENQEVLKQFLSLLENIQSSDISEDSNLLSSLNKLLGRQEDYLANPELTKSDSSLPAVQKSDAHTTNGIMNATLANSGILNERIGGFVGNSGVASGDAFKTFGAWIQGNFGTGQQKAYQKEPGYKFNQRGVTIGVDTGDESLIGAALSYSMNDVTNKTTSSTKDKITTLIGSLYGMYVINPEFFVSGQFSYGASTIKKSRNTGDLANNKATAKPKGTTIGGRAEVGYVYAFDNATQLVPTVGFAVNKVDVKGYTEKGNGLNRTVGKRTSSRNSGLFGLTLRHVSDTESMKIMPEVHANIDYAFSGKNSATNISLGNGLISTTTLSEKISKMYFNLGTSVKLAGINSNMIDVTAGYDLGLAKKFISHTGALKLRVNF